MRSCSAICRRHWPRREFSGQGCSPRTRYAQEHICTLLDARARADGLRRRTERSAKSRLRSPIPGRDEVGVLSWLRVRSRSSRADQFLVSCSKSGTAPAAGCSAERQLSPTIRKASVSQFWPLLSRAICRPCRRSELQKNSAAVGVFIPGPNQRFHCSRTSAALD